MMGERTSSLTTHGAGSVPAPPRRTLKAPAAALARVQKVLPVEPVTVIPSAAQHAADKSSEKASFGQPKPAIAQPKPTSDEVAKSNTPELPDPELAARRHRRNALFLKLREISPALFAAIPPPPMAIGTRDVLVERLGLDPEGQVDLKAVIGAHVHRVAYQKALMAEGAVRIDVDGMPAGEVTPDQREHAIERLAQMKAKRT
jgi:hypothetical protein